MCSALHEDQLLGLWNRVVLSFILSIIRLMDILSIILVKYEQWRAVESDKYPSQWEQTDKQSKVKIKQLW